MQLAVLMYFVVTLYWISTTLFLLKRYSVYNIQLFTWYMNFPLGLTQFYNTYFHFSFWKSPFSFFILKESIYRSMELKLNCLDKIRSLLRNWNDSDFINNWMCSRVSVFKTINFLLDRNFPLTEYIKLILFRSILHLECIFRSHNLPVFACSGRELAYGDKKLFLLN